MSIVKKLVDKDAIYIAGLFDGEGCISIVKDNIKIKKDDSYRTPTYTLHSNINMTNKKIIEWLSFKVGGKYYFRQKPILKNWKPTYCWHLCGEDTVSFIKQIYPYLKIKHLQAKIAFSFAKTIDTQIGGIRKRVSLETNAKRKQLYSKMSHFNRRGIKS